MALWLLPLCALVSQGALPGPQLLLSGAAAKLPVIAIDAGHGGAVEGAVGICGLKEKEVTLAIAKRLTALLNTTGRLRAVLTRSDDSTVDLNERIVRAEQMQAELLLSVHANASSNPEVHGIESFFVSTEAASRHLVALAQRESEGQGIAVKGAPSLPLDLNQVLLGLSLDDAHRQSQALALRLQQAMGQSLHSRGRGVLQAPFWLLAHANMAAALVEVGFLTHPQECQRLANEAHQDTIATALAGAVLAHVLIQKARFRPSQAPPKARDSSNHLAEGTL